MDVKSIKTTKSLFLVLLMNSDRYLKEKKIFTIYHDSIKSSDLKKFIDFLHLYIQTFEDMNSGLRCTVLTSHPREIYFEDVDEIVDVYNEIIQQINSYTNNLQNHMHHKTLIAKLIACLGVIYEEGLFGIVRDKDLAFKNFQQSAQLNCPYGTFKLAQCFEKGNGVRKNIKQALYFYRCAAKLGSIEALHTFGTILLQNNFTGEYSEEVGLVYLKLAAKKASKKYPYACFDYSRYVEHNLSIGKGFYDHFFCFDTYLKGATLDCSNSQFKIAEAYENGDLGVERSISDAIKWFKRAATLGHPEALLKIADYVLYKKELYPEDIELVYSYALKSLIAENCRAAKYISILHHKGLGTKKSKHLSNWWDTVYKVMCKNQKVSPSEHSFVIFDNLTTKNKQQNDEIPIQPIYTTKALKAL